jgi:ribosomal protein S19
LRKKRIKKAGGTTDMRKEIILPEYIGKRYLVDTGKKEKKEIVVKLEHIGKKFGELVPTKVPAKYKKK